jgi:hypothetical protein
VDYIGLDSVFGPASPPKPRDVWEVRLRIAARTADAEHAARVVQEMSLTYFGPAGAGGVRTSQRQLLGMHAVLVPRADVPVDVQLLEV